MSEPIELYRPSNGTEGDIFVNEWCAFCAHNPTNNEAENQCETLFKSFVYGIEEEEYPNEWRYIDGRPGCTRFQQRDSAVTPRCKLTNDMFNGDTP